MAAFGKKFKVTRGEKHKGNYFDSLVTVDNRKAICSLPLVFHSKAGHVLIFLAFTLFNKSINPYESSVQIFSSLLQFSFISSSFSFIF